MPEEINSSIPIPEQSKLEERFSFIDDTTLRSNIAITFRYIIFLIELEHKTPLPGPIIYSLYKDMIIQTAAVIESCMHYALKRHIDTEKIKSSDVMEEEWIEEKCIILDKSADENRQVCGVIRHKSSTKLTRNTNFININRACKRGGVITEAIFEKAEIFRESRNKIHLAGLTTIDDIYTKEDVDMHFKYAGLILDQIEKKLKEI